MLKSVMEELLLKEYLIETADIYRIIKLDKTSQDIIDGSTEIVCKWSERKEEVRETQAKMKKSGVAAGLTPKQFAVFGELKKLRLAIAREENMPPYIIFSDKTLVDMCMKLPFTKTEMLAVNGVGENKYERYGERFIQCIVDCTDAVR